MGGACTSGACTSGANQVVGILEYPQQHAAMVVAMVAAKVGEWFDEKHTAVNVV